MESDMWSLLAELLTRTVGQSANSEIEKVRSLIPETDVHLQNTVNQVDFLLHHLEEKHRQRIISRILGDISVCVEHIWHYSASCLRVCYGGEDSNESVVTACRVALQESWYTDTGSPGFSGNSPLDSSNSGTASRSVIYLSPAAPSHLRRWLSLNLCCSGLLITVLPAEDNSTLPTISVPYFERFIQNDLHLGRQPLLLIAYAGQISNATIFSNPTVHQTVETDYLERMFSVRCAVISSIGLDDTIADELWYSMDSRALDGYGQKVEVRSTLTGSSDYLPALARICRRHKIWLHVEGLSFLRLALLTSPPVKPSWMTTINSINLELSLCFGLPRSLNILLMQSKMPESILLYLNVFPLTTASEETEGATSLPSRSLPSTCLSDALFAWFSLRIQDGSHVNRLRHADHLTAYTLKKMESLPSVEIFPSHQCLGVTTSNGDRDSDIFFIKMLCENSVHCPLILFRYVLSSSQNVMSESSDARVDKDQDRPMDRRFLNSLNHWTGGEDTIKAGRLSSKRFFTTETVICDCPF
ncbi:Pyridoxal-dependent decarboxylase domain-containing protein [Echinococcus granulosus]|uniref:Pyridoxal-dependent decarboxylase domain-containing protein n=1 Tax=Echinococcus granulosus TaxID=6210 RepID=W6UA58_ECHGR|nr:Pyridoxal-dependent decarboxylase domain-containing protein [Echinococcus granulosus]EUB57925.1 Pyridoxal-dependent decarboxylase domain-containing protein [Echinococcus granulosus]